MKAFLHILSVVGQVGNVALDVVPPRTKPLVAAGLALLQAFTHFMDRNAPGFGLGESK